jgi:ribosomal protein S18 acetylase RimI-like enzyme
MIEDLTDLAGFLPEASWMVTHLGAPSALIISGHTPGGVFGQVHLLAVVPRHRRRGLATYLTRKALWALHDKGLYHATLQVNRENRNAVRFFRTVGFQVNAAGVYR